LSYEIARNYMPASGANYANLYINDTLWGLYTNVESVEGEFLNSRFESKEGTFIKCNPKTLDLFGENSNLSNTHGTDSLDYIDYYELRSNYGWSHLYQLIDTLNNSSNNIASVLNVDQTLWMHAFNYSLINFDSYVGYAQNYYLYRDHNNRFNPIIWDLNMSFASFRFTDAADHFSGFSVSEAMTIDPLQHVNGFSVFPRPLIRNILQNDRYRKMYLAHMRTIVDENFSNQLYFTRAQHMQNLIDQHVQNDTNKFYSYSHFTNNLTSTVADLIEYPGITELIDNRVVYLNSYPGFRGEPQIISNTHIPKDFKKTDDLTIQCKVQDAIDVILAYRFNTTDLFKEIVMFDDGAHNDSLSNDGIFAATISNVASNIEYYIYAENDTAGAFSPARAAYEFHQLQSRIAPGDLVINEFMAINRSSNSDAAGEYDDWIELYNNSNESVFTDGLFLSDDRTDLQKWAFPEIEILKNTYRIIWADEDVSQPGLHANFKLDDSGETIYLSYGDGSIVDSIKYGRQNEDFSTGRFPNGSGTFAVLSPTLNRNNNTAKVISDNSQSPEVLIFPNPASEQVNIATHYRDPFDIEIFDTHGRIVHSERILVNSGITIVGTENLTNGLYLVRTKTENLESHSKLVIN
ncbi:MAG: T9SS type A sorting domain-containing protein, partial [Bacteroidia bacterium]|nr:T9SS type A sorting domain-containing protein [Bacteroidia bacterium]